jgi:site-specific DNA-methyltransferase (cytosine-N4-specific)
MKHMQLTWHRYKYYSYEKDLARREIESLLNPTEILIKDDNVQVVQPRRPELASRLVYFSGYAPTGAAAAKTQQALLGACRT